MYFKRQGDFKYSANTSINILFLKHIFQHYEHLKIKTPYYNNYDIYCTKREILILILLL